MPTDTLEGRLRDTFAAVADKTHLESGPGSTAIVTARTRWGARPFAIALAAVLTLAFAVLGVSQWVKSDDQVRRQPAATTPRNSNRVVTAPVRSVAIAISGDSNVPLQGRAGQCITQGRGAYGYSFRGSDYPDLGVAGYLAISVPTPRNQGRASITLVVGSRGYRATSVKDGIVVKEGGRRVVLNQRAINASTGARVRLVGSIRCQ